MYVHVEIVSGAFEAAGGGRTATRTPANTHTIPRNLHQSNLRRNQRVVCGKKKSLSGEARRRSARGRRVQVMLLEHTLPKVIGNEPEAIRGNVKALEEL